MNTIRFRSFDLLDTESRSGIEEFVCLLMGNLSNKVNETFYVIEHILLIDEKQNPGEPNKLTIVFPDWIDQFRQQEMYIELFKDRLPAHIAVDQQWLNPEKMTWFKRTYFNWRSAWATDGSVKITDYSNEIRNLLSIQ